MPRGCRNHETDHAPNAKISLVFERRARVAVCSSPTGWSRPEMSYHAGPPSDHQAVPLIPSLAIRLSSVVGLSPRRSAAPPSPRTRQFTASSMVRMCMASSPSSV